MKPGPKGDPARAFARKLFRESMSDRTFATYWRANCVLAELVALDIISQDERRSAVGAATRPNGSFNACKFARIADQILTAHLDELTVDEP